MKNQTNVLESTITNLLSRGTAIASFDYHGQSRNVVIGANASAGDKDDAKVLIGMKDKNIPIKNITHKLAERAFPEIFK